MKFSACLLSLLGLAVPLLVATPARAALVISEFSAENEGVLHDSDGESPDWIEIQNLSTNAVSLGGWRLTDTITNLSLWTFPATNLPGGTRLLVFASGKDRAVSGAELHTNFELDNDGEYLALVQPSGVVEHAYAPAFPVQRSKASFGLQSKLGAVSANSRLKYFVPPNGDLALTWTSPTFSDLTWSTGTNGVGYDRTHTATNPTSVVLSIDFDERGSTPVTQDGFSSFIINSNVSATTIQTNPTTRTFGEISLTFSNTAPHGYDDRVRNTPLNSGAFTQSSLLRDHIMSRELTSTGGLDLTFTGLVPSQDYVVTVWSFDTGSSGRRISDWYANGNLVKSNYVFDGTILPTSDADYQFSFGATATPAGELLVSGRRDMSSLANNPAVQINAIRLGIKGYREQIMSDLESVMYGVNSSVYLRLPFALTNAAAVQNLRLKVRYDDGFIAYINGQVVASRNAPASPKYNSAATAAHLGLDPETIPLILPAGLLFNGTNILAIHGLNIAKSDNDFLIQAELEGDLGTSSPQRYLWPVTPGEPNGQGYSGFVADTKFSVNRGFYDAPIQVVITSATPAATIYWSTNGSPPSPTSGFSFSSPVVVDRTLAIRAAAFAPDLIPTDVETHSYVFLEQVLTQPNSLPDYPTLWQGDYPADYEMDPNVVYHPVYGQTISNDLRSLPTLSVVMSHADLWDVATGIYRNSNTGGPGWERSASVELIAPDGSTEFAENCGVEIHGNASRDNARTPKHSFKLRFRSEYGAAKLRYDWFDGRVSSFDNIVVRALGFGDAWATRYSDANFIPGTTVRGSRYRPENATYLKDTWIKESFREMGHLATRSDFAHLYLNGLYWGLVNPSERNEAAFVASHLGGREMDWDVMAGDEAYASAELRDGFRYDWDQLILQVRAGVYDEAAYQAVLAKVDVVNLIDYMMVHGLAEMEDWPFHNWYAAHRRATNGVPGTKWIFLPWDQEIGMDRFYRRDRIIGWGGSNVANTPGEIYTALRSYPEFLRLYGDRIQKHLFNGGALTTSNCIARFERLGARIFQALVPESARWGDAREFTIGANPGTGQTFTRDEWWVTEMQQLFADYFGNLHEKYISNFQAFGLYPLTAAPQFSQFGGGVAAGFELGITHTNADGVVFYTVDGTDPREYGTAAVAVTAQAYSVPVLINSPTLVSARVLGSSGWSALVEATFYPPQDLQKLVLSELMYHPPSMGVTNGEEFEFIELKNAGTNALDLTGLAFTRGISFSFTNGTILAPGGFFVLVRNPDAFAIRYPGIPPAGVYTGKLDDSGEEITLSHPTGATVFSLQYGDTTPWPATADGHGFSLVQRSPVTSQAPDDGAKWRASAQPGGSPGTDDPMPGIPPVVINELLAHTDPPDLDSIELYNPTATNTFIEGWYLTDDPGYPWKFQIPTGTVIGPKGYVYFTANDFNAFPGSLTNFALSSLGDEVYLFSAGPDGQLTGYAYGVAFGASFNGVSFGRVLNEVGQEFHPSQKSTTLGQPNAGPRIGPIVMTEVHYHPETNSFEFIELFNTSPAPAALFDALYPTNSWKTKGIDYTFPPGIVMGSNEVVVLAGTTPSEFRARFAVPAAVRVFGPFVGALDNSGENIQLLAPDHPDVTGVPYVAIEELRYNDQSPWPIAADGGGLSLQRRVPLFFANSPANWRAATPTPGTLALLTDTDGDTMPDDWEVANGTNPLVPDGGADLDLDGMTNAQEFLAGTDPQSAASVLRLELRLTSPGNLNLQFTAVSNRTYSVLYAEPLGTGAWLKWTNVTAHTTNRLVGFPQSAGATERFFRLVTPAQP